MTNIFRSHFGSSFDFASGPFPYKQLGLIERTMAPRVPKGYKVCDDNTVVPPSTEPVFILYDNYWWKCQIIVSPNEGKGTKTKKSKPTKNEYVVMELHSMESWKVVPVKIAVKMTLVPKESEQEETEKPAPQTTASQLKADAPSFMPAKTVEVVPESVAPSKSEEMKQFGPRDNDAVSRKESELLDAHNSGKSGSQTNTDVEHVSQHDLDLLSAKIQKVGLHLNPSDQVIQGVLESEANEALSEVSEQEIPDIEELKGMIVSVEPVDDDALEGPIQQEPKLDIVKVEVAKDIIPKSQKPSELPGPPKAQELQKPEISEPKEKSMVIPKESVKKVTDPKVEEKSLKVEKSDKPILKSSLEKASTSVEKPSLPVIGTKEASVAKPTSKPSGLFDGVVVSPPPPKVNVLEKEKASKEEMRKVKILSEKLIQSKLRSLIGDSISESEIASIVSTVLHEKEPTAEEPLTAAMIYILNDQVALVLDRQAQEEKSSKQATPSKVERVQEAQVVPVTQQHVTSNFELSIPKGTPELALEKLMKFDSDEMMTNLRVHKFEEMREHKVEDYVDGVLSRVEKVTTKRGVELTERNVAIATDAFEGLAELESLLADMESHSAPEGQIVRIRKLAEKDLGLALTKATAWLRANKWKTSEAHI